MNVTPGSPPNLHAAGRRWKGARNDPAIRVQPCPIQRCHSISTVDILTESMARVAPEHFLPLPVAEFHILLSLADADRHGYAIMTEIAGRTAGSVRIGPGTLYGAVKRMLDDGLIEERPVRGGADERRRTYRLTALGRAVAKAEAVRLEALVRHARGKRLLDGLERA
jgi:DNA-binding PadR family transcriptional regulator